METKLPIESPNAERPPIRESPCLVTASGQREFELTGNPTMPQSGLQWPHPSKVATNKAIWCPPQTTDPFLSPGKAGQKSRCGAYTDDGLLLQGKIPFFPLTSHEVRNAGKIPPAPHSSLVLYWFLENSLKGKPGILCCSLPSPKAKQIVSPGREGTQKHWSHQPPLYVRTALEASQGSPVLPAPEPCVSMCIHLWRASDSATLQSMYEWFRLPLRPPLSVNPELSWVILFFCDYAFLFPLLTFLTRSLNQFHSPLSAVLLWDLRTALGNGVLSSVPCIDTGWYLLWEPCSPVGLHINSALTLLVTLPWLTSRLLVNSVS